MPAFRRVAALRGAQWVVNAYALFARSPRIWMLLVLMVLVFMLVSGAIPVLGPLVFGLLFPIFSAGLAHAARATDRGETVDLSHLFVGFRASTGDLVAVGGIYLVGQLVVVAGVLALGGAPLYELLGATPAAATPPQTSAPLSGRALAAAVLGIALLTPLLMATWFAPLLVLFHQQKAVPALQTSFYACRANWLAFVFYLASLGLIMLLARLLVSVLALVPMLGPGLALAVIGALIAVLAPIGFIAFYTSYIDVFAEALEPADPAADRVVLP
ncbi:MAG: hypothetical protein H7125_00035 [Proteobacteria bacterium]|nr:hypothetical protein [Burkholderiales bacterium]